MAETWKFNGIASTNAAKTLPNKVNINGKAYLDDTLYYTFTFLEYNDEWTLISFGAAGFWNSANSTYREANILVFDTAPTGELLTFLQSCATKQVTLKQQVEQHITDAYTAIGNKSGTIPTQKNLANLAGAIGTISTGVDTTDGNIEPTTVLKGYKGYAKGVAVNGAIETYDGTVEDVVKISGLIGLTNSSGALTLTDDIAGASPYNTTSSGTYVTVTSTLDDAYPFNEIGEYTDSEGNVFATFPKMWIKWIKASDGILDGFKCSNVQVDSDYFIPDCFIAPSGNGYIDKICIGKYEGSGSSLKVYSKSGSTCLASIKRADARAGCRSYGNSANYYNGYQQLDMSMYVLYNMLCMMYYRTANIQTVYAGRTSFSSAQATGSCDGINGKNGWNTSTGCVKMLNVENPYGNIGKWVDGITFSGTSIYVKKLPSTFDDSTSGAINLGFARPTNGGYVKSLKTGATVSNNSYVYASNASGSNSTYYGDFYTYGSNGVALYVGGDYDRLTDAGLWYFSGNNSASAYGPRIGVRLCGRLN